MISIKIISCVNCQYTKSFDAWAKFILAVLFSALSSLALAQGGEPIVHPDTWERLNLDSVSALDSPFSESYDINSGMLSFENVDVTIPGNFPIPFSIRRKKALHTYGYEMTGEFADWSLEVPSIKSRLISYYDDYSAWGGSRRISPSEPAAECSSRLGSDFSYPNGGQTPPFTNIESYTFWNGDHLVIPGEANEKILTLSDQDSTKTTKSNHKITCFDREDGTGEGFIVTNVEGIRYTFDKPKYRVVVGDPNKQVAALMRVSKIEDRFGNYVEYHYEPGKYSITASGQETPYYYQAGNLDSITSSDGRFVDFIWKDYGSSSLIEKIVVGEGESSRTWEYQYEGHLKRVLRPDGSKWEYDISSFGTASLLERDRGNIASYSKGYYEGYCEVESDKEDDSVTHSVTDPYGNKAIYTMAPIYHGRSNFLHNILNQGHTKPPGAAPSHPGYFFYINVNCTANWGLVRKEQEVTGGQNLAWEYEYSQNRGGYIEENGSVILAAEPITFSNGAPDSVGDAKNYKTTTITLPNQSKEVHYLNRDYSSFQEGKTVAIDYLDTNGDTILKRSEFHFERGDNVGVSGMSHENLNPIHYRVNLVEQKTKLYSSGVPTSYSSKFEDFNAYGAYRKSIEAFGTGSAKKSRYKKITYFNDTDQWILNQLESVSLSSSDQNYTEVRRFDYQVYPSASDAGMLRNKEYWYGIWVNRNAEYYSDGNIKKIEFNQSLVDESGNEISGDRYQSFSGYKRGLAQLTTLPGRYSGSDNLSIERVVDDNGWITYSKDLSGAEVNYGYDELGRISFVDPVDTAWVDTVYEWSWNSDQPQRSIYQCTISGEESACTPGSIKLTNTTVYDSLLRALKTVSRDEESSKEVFQSYRYNFKHQPLFKSFPSFVSGETQGETFEYDGLQRLKFHSVSNGGNSTTKYLSNNVVEYKDFNGNVTTTTYLAYGEPNYDSPTNVASPENVTTNLKYNTFGNVTEITQSGDHKNGSISVSEYRAYDARQNLCKIQRPDVGTTVFQYNDLREMKWKAVGVSSTNGENCTYTDHEGRGVDTFYDNLGAIREIRYDDNSPTLTYVLSDIGDVEGIVSGQAAQVYTYNSKRLVEDETLSIDSKIYTLDYDYSPLGYLESSTYPDGEKVNFFPNAFGQATEAASGNRVYITGAEYHANGISDTFTFGNGIVHKTSLNNRLMPEQIRDHLDGVNRIQLNYTYDYQGNVKSIIDGVNSNFSLTSLNYDGLDRLVSTTGGVDVGSSSLQYDAVGNITFYQSDSQANPHGLIYNYDLDSNRLLGVSGPGSSGYDFNRADSYDYSGNVTHNGKRSFQYNLAGQMVQSESNEYLYDGHNRRIKTSEGKGDTYSLYSHSGKLIYRETEVGGINYVYLGKKLVAKAGAGVVVPKTSRRHFKPFGESIEEPEDDVGYTGHKFDSELGLNYMQARYYDPAIGRFYSNDPVGALGHLEMGNPVHGFNRYAYANNNPYKYVDPDGRNATNISLGTYIGARLNGDSHEEAIRKMKISIDTSKKILETAVSMSRGGPVIDVAEVVVKYTEGESITEKLS